MIEGAKSSLSTLCYITF